MGFWPSCMFRTDDEIARHNYRAAVRSFELNRLRDENAAFRRIMADQLRRGGCPDDLIDEAIDKAVRDA